MADIFDEIADDIKQDNFRKIFDKYGTHLVSFLILIIVSTAGGVWYKNHSNNKMIQSADEYFAIKNISGANAEEKQIEALLGLSKDATESISAIAKIDVAKKYEAKKEVEKALALYSEVAKESSIKAFADFAYLRKIALQRKNNAAEAEISEINKKLEELSEPGRTWRFSAMEISALMALESNEAEKAKEILQKLQSDIATPRSIKNRAKILLSRI